MTVFSNVHTLKKNAFKKTVNAFVPRSVVVPINQELESKCGWLVNPGDTVKEGQLIASSDGDSGEDLFSSVYSPIPGKVVQVESCICPDGRICDGLRIDLAGSFSFLGKKKQPADPALFSGKMILDSLKEKGIVNTFVTNEPVLLVKEIRKVKDSMPLLVVRLFDEDPTRLTDSLVTKLFQEKVVKGAFITAKAMNAAGIIFIADKDFITPLQNDYKIPVSFVLSDSRKYPSGYKNEIIKSVRRTEKQAPFSAISKKSLFTDSSTMLEVFRTFSLSMPVIDRYIHVSGDCIPASGLLKVSIGTSFEDLAEQCGGLLKNPAAVIVNGFVSGVSSGTLSAPVTKYVKSVSFVSASRTPDQRQTECVRCGNCSRLCPRGLSPDIIYRLIKNKKGTHDNVFIKSAVLCDNCGLCNSSCPSRLPLSQIIYKSYSGEKNV